MKFPIYYLQNEIHYSLFTDEVRYYLQNEVLYLLFTKLHMAMFIH